MNFFEIHKYPSRENFPVYGNINRLYIDLASNKFYYWQDGQYFKISTVELDQATRNEVTNIINAYTAPIDNRLTELEQDKVNTPAGSPNNYFSESNEYLPLQRFARVRYQSTSSWAKVAEVTLPANADERKSAIFFINCENNTSTTSESWFGILEWNVHETPASNSIKWLVTYGFGENNFNIRYHADTNTLSFFVLPSVGNMNLWLASESTNGHVTSDIVLFDATEGTPRTGTSVASKADYLTHAGHVRDTRKVADIALSRDISATALINALKANGSSDTDKLTTVELVAGMFAELVNGAPMALDTLHELAEALGNDPNFATTISNLIGTKLSKADAQNTYETITNSDYKLALKINKMVPITYESLVALRDSASLIPGQQYRITDFVTTTVQENTQSAGHAFDIIVTAIDESTLSEEARAIQHNGDSYFANSKLEAWQLKYCLDNDTNRFAWADEENGKGVIYRMIDEFNNDVPYDFKNIQFKRKLTDGEYDPDGDDCWVYTFTGISYENNTLVDGTTLKASEYFTDEGSNLYKNNSIGIYEVRPLEEDGFDNILETLSDNVFIGRYNEVPYVEDGPAKLVSFSFNNELGRDCYSNTFGNNCRYNTFGSGCRYNTFGNHCYSNTFGDGCYNNTFGSGCFGNTFGNSCYYNTFGNSCYSNTFGDDCNSSTFKDNCFSNTFGGDCYNNTFGDYIEKNSFGNSVSGNTFGNNVSGSTFGNDVYRNSFGNGVYNNTFGNYVSDNTFGNYFLYNTVKNYVRYVRTPDSAYPNAFQYVTLESGLAGASAANRLNLEGIQLILGNSNTPIKVARGGVGTEIVASWQNGITLAGLRKETPTTANWTEL